MSPRSSTRHRVVSGAAVLLTSIAPGTPGGADTATAWPAPATVAHTGRGLPPKPNVVLITADDMRAGDLRAMPFVRNVLGRRGVRFTDAISPYSLCCPARAEILKGTYTHNNGVRGNKRPNGGYWALRQPRMTLPVWLDRAGYRTGFVGKYLNEYGTSVPAVLAGQGRSRYEIPPGWHHWYGAVGGIYGYVGVRLRVDTPRRAPTFLRSPRYQSRLYADISEQLLGKFHRSGSPFFLWLSSATPHGRVSRQGGNAPIPHPADRHDFDGVSLPRDQVFRTAFNEDTSDKAGPMHDLRSIADRRAELRRFHENRLESLRSLDDAVRDIWEKLRATGELADTVLIFTSDNGFALGEHRRRGKDQPYDSMLRVPMVVSAPGLRQRYEPGVGPGELVRSDHTVTTLDIPTTIKALSGARTPWPMEGVNMMRPASNPDQGGDRAVLIESGAVSDRWPTPVTRFVGVRTDRWTWLGWDAKPVGQGPDRQLRYNALGRYDEEGFVEFYDRWTTPSQVTNIAGDQHTSVSRRLRAMVRERFDCRGRACVWDASLGGQPTGPSTRSR